MTQHRSTRPHTAETAAGATVSGSRGLVQAVDLIFEAGRSDRTGVDLPEAPAPSGLAGLLREEPIGLPGLSEPEALRHYVRLSQRNYAIDLGLFPLGSCTMKHNPRLNEKAARMEGLSDLHPLQPISTVQGALALMAELSRWLTTLTGMPAVALSPKAGAHGELCGMLAIRAALAARGESHRTRVLVPAAAHGTNPATAAACGFTVDEVPGTEDGRTDLAALKAKLGPDVAAVMLTNPNTCGLFEREVKAIADLVHEAGGYFYCDGANYNAIVGRVRPGDLGVDAMHINLHKTFSTPHGGGGPGAGPTVLSEALAPFAPTPYVRAGANGFELVEHAAGTTAFGRMVAFHGQMGMFVRALAYMLSHGSDGLRQVAEDAVLNANYVLARLKDHVDAPFAAAGPCIHEAIFSDARFRAHGVETVDLAKALIDEGYHPMTVYFPLVVHGAMLIEPTETESKAELDRFCDVMIALAQRAVVEGAEAFKSAPRLAPVRRLDETRAARQPKLRWRPAAAAIAAE